MGKTGSLEPWSRVYCNIWCIRFCSKHSSNIVLCLLQNLMHQTLASFHLPKWFCYWGNHHTSMVPYEFMQNPIRSNCLPYYNSTFGFYWAVQLKITKRETKQSWNSKSVFTLSVVNQREIRRKKLKRQQHFVTTWFFFTFPIWSFVMEYFGVMIHNQPNQTKQPTTFCDDDVQILLYTINLYNQIWNESDT